MRRFAFLFAFQPNREALPLVDQAPAGRQLLADLNSKAQAVEFAAGSEDDPPDGPTNRVALTGRMTSMAAGTGQFNVTGNDAALTVTTPATVIGEAVIRNKVALQLSALSLRATQASPGSLRQREIG